MHEESQLGSFTNKRESFDDCLGDVFLADGGLDGGFLVVVRVAFHVKLADSVELVNFSLELRNTLDLSLLLRVSLNLALSNLLFELSILLHLLTDVPESLSLGVEEEIVELGEVQLDCSSLLFTRLWLLGCRLCTHFG